MIVYVRGKTLVKGVRLKDVWYVGDVQDDGYIYFNDEMAYRIPTPETLTRTKQEIGVSQVQIWYTVRNCWIRANHFNQLTIYGFDPKEIYDILDDHEERISDLEERMDAIEQRVTNLEGRMSTAEQNITNLQQRMTQAETNIRVLSEALNSAVNRIAVLEGKVTVLETWRLNLTRDLGDFSEILDSYGSLWGYIEHEVSVMNNFIQTTSAKLQAYDSRISSNSDSIISLSTRMSNVENGYTNLNQALINLSNSLLDLSNSVDDLIDDIESGLAFDRDCRSVIDNQIYPILNFLGDKAFNVNGTSSGWLKSKVNELVRAVNNHHNDGIQEETVIWEHTWSTHYPEWEYN